MAKNANIESEPLHVAVDPAYIPFFQKDYCCVPACIQMILYRRDLPLLSQGTIGKAMGLVIPKNDAHCFSDDIKTSRSKKGEAYGIIVREKLNLFFRRRKVELRHRYVSPHAIDDVTGFVRKNIIHGNDIMISYADPVLEGRRVPKKSICSHDVLIQELNNDRVTCVDPYPDSPELWETKVSHLVEAMPFDHNGFHVIFSATEKSRQALQEILESTKK